jgi:hypothetical protein
MEQSLGKSTDAELIASYRKAESEYGGPFITDTEIIAQCRISESKYGRYIFYKPEEHLFATFYPLQGEMKILGYYETFEEAEKRAHDLLNEILDKLDKTITENEKLNFVKRFDYLLNKVINNTKLMNNTIDSLITENELFKENYLKK